MKKSFYNHCMEYHREELLKQWDDEINEKSFHEVGCSSREKVAWKCEHGHHWNESPAWRLRCKNSDCPFCAHRKASDEYNLAVVYPEVVIYYDIDKNDVLPTQLTPKSSKLVWWKCEHGHHWQQKVSEQVKQSGCLSCRHENASDTYNLKILYPEIAKEWDHAKNKIPPEKMMPYSGKKVSWICSFNPTHKWEATIVNRTRKSQGCKICNSEYKTSFPEQAIYYYIKK